MFWKKKPRVIVRGVGEFTLGQIVYHKLDGTRLVIVGFYLGEYGEAALCARTGNDESESHFYIAELTLVKPQSVDAVDPVDRDTTE